MLKFLPVRSVINQLTLRLRRLIGLGPRVALYVRHSNGDTTGSSFARQLEEVRSYGATLGGNISRLYVDAGGGVRTPLDAFAAAAKRGDFDVLVVQDVDRLTRNVTEFAKLIASGVRIQSVREGGDLANFFVPLSTRAEPWAPDREHHLFEDSIASAPVQK